MKWVALVAFVLVVPGGLVVTLAAWWHQRRRKQASYELSYINTRILLNAAQPRFEGHDDALRIRTERRREAANKMRTRAAKVESGEPVSDLLAMVKRG